ncbi:MULTISPECIES: NarK family nitrate/nitrite MFS transporter [Zhongshania]|jgi:NNP family nitrate/nitrite transporter-like MFS transporter|uniref:Nitrate/nitrite transporter n=1 Tax=Zhongshania antarctica TaxID=641702 RepID=A0A840R5W5_9GAMM|nr:MULTISPECIES: NarK family nitrate/nitrite MFS transporter [Zhongshania]MBB5188217.1 NNP family nitrate/nitrite transporter-like MFS transporter [Zhongshania antarctica]
MSSSTLNVLDLKQEKIRLLHLSWFAFFLSFVVWFNFAPMLSSIKEAFDLTNQQVKALMILNVALTIPARVVVGMLVDRFGPRIVYSALLVTGGMVCVAFAFANSYEAIALLRFLMGFIGAGFVIGIRLVGEWFPARQVGLAEGVYGGWGNFGSAAAAMALPTLALYFGGPDGWRYAIASTGVVASIYGVFFYWRARNTPKGSTYFKPKKSGGLVVSNKRDLIFYIIMCVPMYLALATLTWKLSPANLGLLNDTASVALYAVLVVLFVVQISQILRVNSDVLNNIPIPEMQQYKFKQVAILNVAYFVTFGSELAVVSMLPLFFMETFELSAVTAGMLASGFAFMNLVARPGGGYLSDKFGRRKSLSILICGLAIGYMVLSNIDSSWTIWVAVLATMCCSFFVQAGEGAVFAIVPLVKRSMTGQIAGMTGAYGNVGAVIFLTVLSFVSASNFFLVIAACAGVIFIAVQFMEEPQGHTAEVNDDGSVALIEVS